MKKLISLLLSVTLLLTLTTRFDCLAYSTDLLSGDCGENVSFLFDESTLTMTFSGTGDMYDYVFEGEPKAPYRKAWYYSDIDKVVFEDGVQSIGDFAFYQSKAPMKVTMSDSITRIGQCAFCDCSNLSSINLSENVSEIGTSAFYNCASLTSITIPNGVETINYATFCDCSRLESVVLYDSIKIIGNQAFDRCTSLTDVYYTGTIAQWKAINTGNNNAALKTATIHYNYVPPCKIHTEGETKTENVISATCTDSGSYDETVYCTVCGVQLSKKHITVKALGHNYSAHVVKPACESAGYTEFTCSRCNNNYRQDEKPALGHSWSVETVMPTCVDNGLKTYTCSNCGKTKTEWLPKTGVHNYLTSTKPASCTADGLRIYTCTVCGDRYTETINKLGHRYGKSSLTKAKPSKDGKIVKTCTRCGKTHKTVIPMASNVLLSSEYYVYDGSVKKPTLTVRDSEYNTIPKKYYTVKYQKGRKECGYYTVTVTFKGHYTGKVKRHFTIAPASVKEGSIKTKKRDYNSITVTWNKVSMLTAIISIDGVKNREPTRYIKGRAATRSKFKESPQTRTL